MGESYRATYRRVGREWVVEVDDDRATATATAPSLEGARRAIVEELSAVTKRYGGHHVVEDDIVLDRDLQQLVTQATEARRAAAAAAAESQRLSRRAATTLVDGGLSLRDVAYVLGISHGRVQQLVAEERES